MELLVSKSGLRILYFPDFDLHRERKYPNKVACILYSDRGAYQYYVAIKTHSIIGDVTFIICLNAHKTF